MQCWGPEALETIRDLEGTLTLKDLHGYVRSLGFAPHPVVPKTVQATAIRHRSEHVGNFFLAGKAGGRGFTSEDESEWRRPALRPDRSAAGPTPGAGRQGSNRSGAQQPLLHLSLKTLSNPNSPGKTAEPKSPSLAEDPFQPEFAASPSPKSGVRCWRSASGSAPPGRPMLPQMGAGNAPGQWPGGNSLACDSKGAGGGQARVAVSGSRMTRWMGHTVSILLNQAEKGGELNQEVSAPTPLRVSAITRSTTACSASCWVSPSSRRSR